MEYNDPTLFTGIRFFLAGFNPLIHEQVKARLVSEGGIYVANHTSDCTHVIVYNLLLDDPICVSARRDRKALVTHLWIDHSIESGELADVSNIMYRPLKDLKGIPGAEELVICLTGYQKYVREDIMTMVDWMGAQFSKELAVPKVTHLICNKFEGDKYKVAKRFPGIKLVNHYWLEDCLKAWKLLPEELYNKSTYEVDMMEALVDDSEDETGNITAMITDPRVVNRSIGQNEPGKALDNSVIESNIPVPSALGLSNSVRQDGVMLPLKTEPVSESRNPHKIDSHLSTGQKNEEQNVRKTPLITGPLVVGEDWENLSRQSCKRSADVVSDCSTPLNSRATPKSSNISVAKFGSSKRKTKECLALDNVCNHNSDVDKVKGESANVRTSNLKGLSEVDSGKNISEGSMLRDLVENVNDHVGVHNIGPDKQISEIVGVSNAKPVLLEGEGLGHTDVSCITPESQKLMISASNRINAADPATPLSGPLVKSKIGSHNISGNSGSETARANVDKASTDFPFVKSSVANIATSSSLPFEKPRDTSSPVTGNVASSSVKNKKIKPPNLPENTSYSPEFKKLLASNSGNPALNSDDPAGSSVSKQPKKKIVGRKTLGSRAKVSKKTADDCKCSLNGNFSGDNVALHLDDQIEGNSHANSSVDKCVAPHTVNSSTALEFNPHKDFVFGFNDSANPFNDDADKAEVTNSPSDNTNKLKMPGADLYGMERPKKRLASKKGISGQTKKETVTSAPKKVVQDAADGVGAKASEKNDSVKGHTVVATAKKRRIDQLVEEHVQDEFEPVASDDPGACNVGKHLKNLISKKRRETLLLNKSDSTVEVEKETESALDKDGQQRDVDKLPEKLSGTSNSSNVRMEIENENGPNVGNGQCTNNGVRQTGKKRCGTLLLSKSDDKENLPVCDDKPKKSNGVLNDNVGDDQGAGAIKGKKIAGKKRRGTLVLKKPEGPVEVEKEKESEPVFHDHEDNRKGEAPKSDLTIKKNDVVTDGITVQSDMIAIKSEAACFIVSGHRLQRKEFQQLIKRLKGKHCRDSHQWSYQATHFIVPDPIRRTEKFFAAAASGRWILKTDYLTASSQAGKFLPEEPYEWYTNGLTEDGAISLEAPRKWRLLREKTGHGAFYGMRIVVYGECIAPPLDTLKRVVKAGDGTILATAPPYTRFLQSNVDFAIVSPGITRADIWVQEFLRHEIACVSVDYLVEYVCKPVYPLDRHVQYNTHECVTKSFSRLLGLLVEPVADAATPETRVSDDLSCPVCGLSDRGEVMLVCGDESGSTGCGIGTHIDCCDPPLEDVPDEDWFCPKCTESKTKPPTSTKEKMASKRR